MRYVIAKINRKIIHFTVRATWHMIKLTLPNKIEFEIKKEDFN